MSARCRRAWPARAAVCSRSNAMVAPSGSCSSSPLAAWAAATMSAWSRSRRPSWASAAARSAARRRRTSGSLVIIPAYQPFDLANAGGIGQAVYMAETLTLMAVHAHPDDEASSTGGVLASYSAQGIRTVVVTCTNGEFGDAPGPGKPGPEGHDEQEVARHRIAELRESCSILGVTNLELLGYHDSGMPDWDYKDRPDAFCNIPEADVAARISDLIEVYQP